ncbi:MAG: hypothetical protein HS116_25840 [Planctomycetes bacterium]|nr:hypothetical protein [Planctomycetota bacterium]
MVFHLQRSLANDGKLDAKELEALLELAARDGEIDIDERRVLRVFFSEIKQKDVTEETWAQIGQLRGKMGF